VCLIRLCLTFLRSLARSIIKEMREKSMIEVVGDYHSKLFVMRSTKVPKVKPEEEEEEED